MDVLSAVRRPCLTLLEWTKLLVQQSKLTDNDHDASSEQDFWDTVCDKSSANSIASADLAALQHLQYRCRSVMAAPADPETKSQQAKYFQHSMTLKSALVLIVCSQSIEHAG